MLQGAKRSDSVPGGRRSRLGLLLAVLVGVVTMSALYLRAAASLTDKAATMEAIAKLSAEASHLKRELADAHASASRERQAKRDSLVALEKALSDVERLEKHTRGSVCNDDDPGLQAESRGVASKCAAVKQFCRDPSHGPTMQRYCPRTCGLCSSPPAALQAIPMTCEDDDAGLKADSQGHASACARQREELCRHHDQGPIMRKNCPKTCGLCSLGSAQTPAASYTKDYDQKAEKALPTIKANDELNVDEKVDLILAVCMPNHFEW